MGGLRGGEGSGVLGGFSTTLGGRMLNPGTQVGRLGLGPTVDVVFHGRVKGRGVLVAARRPGPGGKDVRHVLHAPLLWDKNTCCRCGAPRFSGVATTVRGARVVGRAREACTKVDWPRGWEACGSSAQMAVIKRTPQEVIPRTERGRARRFLGRGVAWAGELSSQSGPDPCGGPGW